jgi:hypothetical protein
MENADAVREREDLKRGVRILACIGNMLIPTMQDGGRNYEYPWNGVRRAS